MSTAPADPQPRERSRSPWTGVWWVEGALVSALAIAALAFLSELDDCSFIGGCAPEEAKTEPGTYLLLATALGLLFGGLATAAYAGGRPIVEAVARGAFGCLVICGAIWYVWPPEGAGYVAPLVLGVGAACAAAIPQLGRDHGSRGW